MTVDGSGNLYIADTGNNVVREVSEGIITTFAGDGTAGYLGDGQAATSAELNVPSGLAIFGDTLYIADSGNNVIREVASGNITTAAGNAEAIAGAPWVRPTGLAVDSQGDLFVADASQNVVYEVSPAGSITTVASNLNDPTGLAVDSQGDLFIADAGNDVVREVTPGPDGLLSDGTMTIVAGNGTRGYSGDNGPANAAQLDLDSYQLALSSLAVDTHGDLFIADSANELVREVLADPGTGTVSPTSTIITYANWQGGGESVFDGPPTGYKDPLQGIAVDAQGDLYIATSQGEQGEVIEVVPDGNPFNDGVDFYSLNYNPYFPTGLAVDAQGNLFAADLRLISEIPSFASPSSAATPLIGFPFPSRQDSRLHWLAAGTQGDLFFEFFPRGVERLTGGSITVAVVAAPTTTTVTVAPSTSVSGQSVTFTAAVTPRAGGAIPAGSIQFEVDGTDVGSPVTLGNTGTASLSLNSLGLGSHAISAVYSSDTANFNPSAGNTSITVVAATASNIESVVNSAPSSGGSVTLQATSNSAVSTALQAVDTAAPTNAVTVTLDLDGAAATPTTAFAATGNVQVDLTSSSGTATVQGATVNSGTVIVAAGVAPVDWTVNGGNVIVEGSASAGDFIINGGTVMLADGTVITGNSPAITVNGGTVILQGVTAQTATNSPTIVVNGGSLIVRNSTIEESTGYAQAAILINGGTVDLGTTASPGGNTFNVNGTGTLIQNTTSGAVSAIGDTFENNGAAVSSKFGTVGLAAPAAKTANQGLPQPFNLGSLTDTANDSQSWAIDINWGDGTAHTDFNATSTSPLSAQSHAFDMPGTYTVTVTATDPVASGVSAWDLIQSFTVTVAPSVIILDPSAGGALSLSGNAALQIPGAIVVDSSSSTALSAGGNASVKAAAIDVHGKVQKSGNVSFSPAPVTAAATVSDPLANLPVPVAERHRSDEQGLSERRRQFAANHRAGCLRSDHGIRQCEPHPPARRVHHHGRRITVSGNANVAVSGSSNAITGTDVMIFNAGTGYNAATGTDGGGYGAITLSGNGTIKLTAPTTGTYTGISSSRTRDNAKPMTVSGNAMQGIAGTIYAPAAQLDESGNAAVEARQTRSRSSSIR